MKYIKPLLLFSLMLTIIFSSASCASPSPISTGETSDNTITQPDTGATSDNNIITPDNTTETPKVTIKATETLTPTPTQQPQNTISEGDNNTGDDNMPKTYCFITAYTSRGDGLYMYTLDVNTGKLHLLASDGQINQLWYSIISSDNKYLYTVGERWPGSTFDGGVVASYEIDWKNNKLNYIGSQPAYGTSTCHLALDSDEKTLLVANYGSGDVTVYPVNNGKIGEKQYQLTADDFRAFDKTGYGNDRKPHAHYVEYLPKENRFCYVDLGFDSLVFFTIDNGVKINETVRFPKDSGPRHIVTDQNAGRIYLLTEYSSELFVLEKGKNGYEIKTSLSALPENYVAESTGATVKLYNGYIYTSNRGHDSITIFKYDKNVKKLSVVDRIPTGGAFPRDFEFTPDGKYMIVTHHISGNAVVYRVSDGGLKFEKTDELMLPAPICVKFAVK